MSDVNIEELFVNAAEQPSAKVLNELLKQLRNFIPVGNSEIADNIDFLLDSWEAELNIEQATFITRLAEMHPQDTPMLRKTMTVALKTILPPFLAKPGYLRALGLRDSSTIPAEISRRLQTLLNLKSGIFMYQTSANRWSTITSVDEYTATVTIVEFNGPSSHNLPLEKVLSDVKLFTPGPDMQRAARLCRKLIPAKDFKTILNNRALIPVSEKLVETIAQGELVPKKMTPEEFGNWWNSGVSCDVLW